MIGPKEFKGSDSRHVLFGSSIEINSHDPAQDDFPFSGKLTVKARRVENDDISLVPHTIITGFFTIDPDGGIANCLVRLCDDPLIEDENAIYPIAVRLTERNEVERTRQLIALLTENPHTSVAR